MDVPQLFDTTFLWMTLDSYMFNSENLSLTIMSPLTPPSPLRGEGKGEGKISNIFG